VYRLLPALLTVSMAAPAAEFVIFRNGMKVEIERHEQEGTDVWLHMKNGLTNHADLAEITRFEPIVPPEAKPPAVEPLQARQMNDPARRLVEEAAVRHGVDPDLVHAVAQAESGYQQKAVSRVGAIGIMQLMPATAKYLGANPHDAVQNVDAGVRFLRELLLKYRDHPNQVALALAAYNAGPHAVERYRGVPPYRETRMYVKQVIHRFDSTLPPAPPR
jgi:hypothetical protein